MMHPRQSDAALHKLLYPTDEVGDQASPTGFTPAPVYRDANKKGVWFRVPLYHSDRGDLHHALKLVAEKWPDMMGVVAYKLLQLPPLAKLSDLLVADADQIAPALLEALTERLTPGMDAGV